MLSKEEIKALSACVGSAIGEFGASDTTDLAIEAIRKLESGLTPRALDASLESGQKFAPEIVNPYPCDTN